MCYFMSNVLEKIFLILKVDNEFYEVLIACDDEDQAYWLSRNIGK